MKGFATVLLAAGILCSCSDDACLSYTGRSCDDGVVYWIDSCGNYQELIEECRCGCRADRSGCKRCDDCTCTQAGTCCDGCLPINNGDFCDDGDAGTRLDLCQDGACAGWAFTVEEPELPAEPAAPEPVRLQSWTCPPVWSPVEHDSLLTETSQPFSWCRPPPLPRLRAGGYITPLKEGESDGDRPVCEPEVDGTFPLLGHADCRPLGDPCPAGDWPEVPPEITGTRIYAKAGAVGGTGTPALPFATIQAAVDAAAPGDVVVIAAGTYPESVSIPKDLTLWGACVQQTVIAAPDPGGGANRGAVVVGSAAQVGLRNLRLSGEQVGVQMHWSNAQVLLDGVWIHQTTQAAIDAMYGDLVLRQVLVDSTRSNAASELGFGIIASDGATCTAQSVTLENNRFAGLVVYSQGTTVNMQDAAVRNTQSQEATGEYGRGLLIQEGAQVGVTRGLFDSNRELGVFITSTNSRLQLEDVVVQDTQCAETTGDAGSGVWVQYGATGILTRVLLLRNREEAIGVDGEGTDLQMEDVVVLDTRVEDRNRSVGRGALVEYGATLGARRCLFEENRSIGILAIEQAQLSLQDMVVRETLPAENNREAGVGLWVLSGSTVTLRRGWFERNRDVAVIAGQPDTLVELEDIVVQETLHEESSRIYGYGLLVAEGAQANTTRALFEGNQHTSIRADSPDTLLRLTDVTVRNTGGQDLDSRYGYGLRAASGARAELTRCLLEENRDAGIVADQPGTTVVLQDVTVRDTLASQYDLSGGEGIWVSDGAEMTCTRGRFERNRNVAIYGDGAGTRLQLSDVTVLETAGRLSDLDKGYGLAAAAGAVVTVQRGRFEGNHSTGIGATHTGTTVTLSDVTVRDTRSRESDKWLGRGLEANRGAEVQVTNGLFEQNRDVGIAAFSPGTRLTLEQVVVRDTRQRECVSLTGPDSCAGFGHGSGVGAFQEAQVSLAGVEIKVSQLAGLQLALQGTASGRGVSLSGHPIGVNVQDTPVGYDFFDQVKGLMMEDNQTNFDTTELPIPDPLEVD